MILEVIVVLQHFVWHNTSVHKTLWCKYRCMCVNGSLVEHKCKSKSKRSEEIREVRKRRTFLYLFIFYYYWYCVRSSVKHLHHRQEVNPLVGLLRLVYLPPRTTKTSQEKNKTKKTCALPIKIAPADSKVQINHTLMLPFHLYFAKSRICRNLREGNQSIFICFHSKQLQCSMKN